jgi:hypothetical protein
MFQVTTRIRAGSAFGGGAGPLRHTADQRINPSQEVRRPISRIRVSLRIRRSQRQRPVGETLGLGLRPKMSHAKIAATPATVHQM